ncbi:MAG: Trigger factor [Candidatus Uhrbacteria bacterium GW2011_GWD2_52_7]|uniref:Trigger factor n=1 Tax=Candidatus Uhrbacteria bacterium GW2011_GWD2_52_7 TaxID=1618989 RepID=A0A0G1XDF8_9BACT|nr:MAG: Trigger factor [Candidatus Uhrbacteria bacterium GW2011_GWD2_52_7]
MSHTLERLADNKAKLTITIPADKVRDAMQRSADAIATHAKIPGFRPGKASYDIVKQRFGEMKILEEAAEDLIRAAFVSAMIEEDLDTVGQPFFGVEKMAPDNDLIFTAEIALMPSITKLADYHSLAIAPQSTEPSEAMIDEAKRDLLRMQMKEHRALAGHKLAKGDKAVVNMNMKKDGVVLEGGEAQNHGVYTNEPYYIEGFVDNIIGLSEEEEKTFSLTFPADHYQKHIAGKDVDFTVKLNEIFTLETPAFDDVFAKSLGFDSSIALEEKLKENLSLESGHEESRRQEKAIFDLLAQKSEFDAIPDLLVNQEVDKMLHELEHNVGESGMELKDYLSSIGKSMTDIKLDFTPSALQRIKASLLIREIAKRENISVDEKEVDTELDTIASRYPERVYSPEYRDYVEHQLRNKKTVNLLRGVMIK